MIGSGNADVGSGSTLKELSIITIVNLGKQSDLVEDITSNDKRSADDAVVQMYQLRRIVTVPNERVSTNDLYASVQKSDLLITDKHCVPA